jgi:hypothetical protein
MLFVYNMAENGLRTNDGLGMWKINGIKRSLQKKKIYGSLLHTYLRR